MTATVESSRKGSGRAQKGATGAAPTLPQVNLLPPEVTAARGLHQLKRWLVLGIATVVLALALVYVVAVLSGVQARSDLRAAEEETQRLLAAPAPYAEVPVVLGRLDDTTRARELGMSTEIQWTTYYGAISGALPDGVSIDSLRYSGESPMASAPAPASPLAAAAVGQIQFAARSVTVPTAADWATALDSVPGFSDAWISAFTVTADDAGNPYYTVSGTVQVTAGAYSNRFAADATATSEEG